MPKVFALPSSAPLSQAVSQAMGQAQGDLPPALITDSPAAAAALKSALAAVQWPGRKQGRPLPWCGSLDQAVQHAVFQIASHGGVNDVSLPRALCARRVELAQHLLDHSALKHALAGSARAALLLAGQWVDIFEGWDWLGAAHRGLPATSADANSIASDLRVLAELYRATSNAEDQVPWITQGLKKHQRQSSLCTDAVWFCLGRSPSQRELAMAEILFGVQDSQITVFGFQSIDPLTASEVAPASQERELIAACTLEETAWAGVQSILQWRARGFTDIGVLALDRKVVRRMRALLQRAGEPFGDRSGWALDTTVAASAIAGLNQLLCGPITTQTLLEWVHSPFVATGLKASCGFDAKKRQMLDVAVREAGRVTEISLATLAQEGLLTLPAEVFEMARRRGRQPLARWVDQLLQAAEALGLDAALASDPAGEAVLAALQILQQQSMADSLAISSSLWNTVLAEELNRARFVEPTEEAKVRVVSASSLLWQKPQALLVIGADAKRLPQREMPRFFEPSQLAEMGLGLDPIEEESEGFTAFTALWRSDLPITMIATSDEPDSAVQFSPWVELQTSMPVKKAAEMISPLMLDCSLLPALTEDFQAETQLRWDLGLPDTISVSESQRLVDCPYQYALSSLLALSQCDALEESAQASDLGSLLHHVLKAAPAGFDSEALCADWLHRQIDQSLEQPWRWGGPGATLKLPLPRPIWAQLGAEAFAIVPRLARWLATQSATNSASDSGSVIQTELPLRAQIPDVGVTLKGRLDRLDVQRGVVMDFKTSDPKLLKKRLGPDGNELQLQLYAWLLQAQQSAQPVRAARFVSIRREAVTEIDLTPHDGTSIAQLGVQALESVRSELKEIADGAPVQARGIDADAQICQYCAVRGICRRDDYRLDAARSAIDTNNSAEQTDGP
ncbi:MAG: PD-(D/E)XK nuclease family protein [Betaproteobacteria bacterium]|jgi:ATP-dependent helicase/nuclease subunit B|nr:PD-(D/E)XK nuclease family protein [Betaproteobacteria bacterium]